MAQGGGGRLQVDSAPPWVSPQKPTHLEGLGTGILVVQKPQVLGGWAPTWRIIPFSKWLITMVSKSPNLGLFPFQMA